MVSIAMNHLKNYGGAHFFVDEKKFGVYEVENQTH